MRIVFYSDYYSENMGYSENLIPRAMAERGHEVYVITTTVQVYGDAPFYDEVYSRFLGPRRVNPVVKKIEGVTLKRLPVRCWWSRFRLARGAMREIVRLRPDVVQTFDPRSMPTLFLSILARIGLFRLFTSEHSVASVYPAYYSIAQWPWHRRLYLWLTDTLFGRIATGPIYRCYATTRDAVDIASRFHGVDPARVRLLPLGVDTHLFHPVDGSAEQEERTRTRGELGVMADELACIYTGRLTAAKNPLCLAQAIAKLRGEGERFVGIFLGEGEQAHAIQQVRGCKVLPFVHYSALGRYFRAADIGVWPCQESISMLDAAAAGLPIVVGDRLKARERIEGNGVFYRENDPASLAQVIANLKSEDLRRRLGSAGVAKMREHFSAVRVADELLKDYAAAVSRNPARV